MNLPEKKSFLSKITVVEKSEDGITKWLKSLIAFSALIAVLVFVDYILPSKETEMIVKNLVVRDGFEEVDYAVFAKLPNRIGEEEFWIIFDNDELAVHENAIKEINIGDEITLFNSYLFSINIKAKNNSRDTKEFYPYINIYGIFILFPVVFLLLFGLMFYFKRNSEMIMTLGVIDIISLLGFGFLILFY